MCKESIKLLGSHGIQVEAGHILMINQKKLNGTESGEKNQNVLAIGLQIVKKRLMDAPTLSLIYA